MTTSHQKPYQLQMGEQGPPHILDKNEILVIFQKHHLFQGIMLHVHVA